MGKVMTSDPSRLQLLGHAPPPAANATSWTSSGHEATTNPVGKVRSAENKKDAARVFVKTYLVELLIRRGILVVVVTAIHLSVQLLW